MTTKTAGRCHPPRSPEEAKINSRICKRIVAARKGKGLTQAKLSALAGLPQFYLIRCETGHKTVGAARLAMIAKALDVDISWFCAEDESDMHTGRYKRCL
jgi:transcriptional regulator with XRE-family HTH domain